MAVSQTQRIVDLVYAGHAQPEVANLMGVNENVVQTALRDLTQSPTSQGGSGGSGTVNSLTVVSGTAQEDASELNSEVYVAITGGASGTVAVAIGPTNSTADAIIPTSDATLSRTVSFRLPAGWWFKVTVGGSAAIASAKQITG